MQKKEISIVTQKKLQKLFSYTGKKEQQLEFCRQNLCKIEAFEPYASFQRIDRLCRGYLLPKDIIFFLRDNAFDSNEEIDAKLLINYFDSTQEGRLIYSDYLQMMLPCDQPYLRATATQRPTYPITSKDYLPFDVERGLAKLVHKELNMARKQEEIKQEIAARYDFNIAKLFREVDDWNYKYVDHKNLKRFLSKMGVPATESHLIAIIRRFDLDADAKLTLAEFQEGIQTKLDFSKRQVKEKFQRPTVNNRELVLSPGRVPETLAINKEDTMNHHHSPLRARPSARGGDQSGRRDEPSREVEKRDRSIKAKQLRSKRKQSRSKSKSKVQKTTRPLTAKTLAREFHTFKHQLEKAAVITSERDHSQSHRYRTGMDSNVPSPYRSNRHHCKDLSPLRMKTPVKACAVAAPQCKPASRKDAFSPKSPLSKQINFKSECSPMNGNDLSLVRAARSPYKCEIAKQEEGDASLIYLTRDAFKEILAIEGGLEAAKKELAMRHDFTLAGAFSKFSDNTHGRITANELLFGLEKLGLTCDVSDARMIVDRYDADKDGKLGFWEFSNAILPIQAGLRDEIERKRAIWEISADTNEILKKMFRHIVDAEAMIEGIRQRLQREKSVQLRQAFDSLDWLGRGFITDNEFKRAFEKISERLSSGHHVHQELVVRAQDSLEMEAMIRRFNKDKLNGRISLPEFLDELNPKCSDKMY